MKKSKLLLAVVGASTLLATSLPSYSQTFAPKVHRNTTTYDLSLGRLAVLAVVTSPDQAYQPVYSWRTHKQRTGNGPYGYRAKIIGYTDANGSFTISGVLPYDGGAGDEKLCGVYEGETFAVGSPSNPRSAPINFKIFKSIDFGPRDPNTNC